MLLTLFQLNLARAIQIVRSTPFLIVSKTTTEKTFNTPAITSKTFRTTSTTQYTIQ